MWTQKSVPLEAFVGISEFPLISQCETTSKILNRLRLEYRKQILDDTGTLALLAYALDQLYQPAWITVQS